MFLSVAETLAGTFYGDTSPSTETVFEPSPLNRPEKLFGAGQAWRVLGSEKFVKNAYQIAGDGVIKFELQTNGTVNCGSNYGGSTLFSNVTTSERGFLTYEVKDNEGRITHKLQQLDDVGSLAITGYCYDIRGNLAVVIPPEAYKKLGGGLITSFTESDEIFKELMFGYHFDSQNRQNEKHVPGAGWTRLCYDKRDNLVLENDDKDAAADPNYYKFTKFDALNRPIYSGLINNIGTFSLSQLQTDFDNFSGQNYETVSSSGLFGYTNVSFPSSYTPAEASGRLIMYYDNYDWQTDANYNFQASNAFHNQANAKGMTTGTIVRNLETNEWYRHVNYVDYKGRIIQQFSQNHVGGIDRTDYQYRFNGEVLKMRITHKRAGFADIVEVYEYSYDHVGRKTSFKHTLNGVTKNVSRYNHDSIGRLKQKELSPSSAIGSNQTGLWTNTGTWQGSNIPTISDQVTINSGHTVTIPNGQTVSAGTLFDQGILQNFGTLNLGNLAPNTSAGTLQTVDFSYHIRSGLRGINLDASGNLTDKLFSMRLGYETEGFFDGNIGKQEWKSSLDSQERSFTFSFDGASRILGASYLGNDGENYSLNSVSYDLNGNITALSRNGFKSNDLFGLIDNLSYNYQSNSNKIQAVTDNSGETASFTDATGSTDYTYSQDGSLTSDANKGISLIEYNYLKRPKKYTFSNGSTLENQYDATGKKLKSISSDGTVYDFVGNIIYKNDVLYQISHDEGRIISGEYEYEIKDHLGNLRVSFRDSLGIAKITQKQDYDVYGSELQGLSYTKPLWNQDNFKFLGRESIAQTGLVDLMNRQYDKILGRFTSIDPLAEISRRFTPYNYGLNNPIRFIDPDGLAARSTHTDNSGNVLAVYDDGDLGVYKHDNAQNKADVDKNHSNKNTSAGGTKMGETLHMFSFVNHEIYNKSNGTEIVAARGANIDFGSTWAHDQVSGILNEHPTALGYANKARGGHIWDIKGHSPNGSTMFGSILGTGANGTNIYASARDAGNFAAGAVADDSYLPTRTILNGFGAYNLGGNNAWKAGLIWAATIGGNVLSARPNHGEDPLSYKAINSGVNNRINYFWNTMWNTKK